MNFRLLGFGLLAALATAGCRTYRGAVYSEYSQVGIDVRASAVSSSPVSASFGYDRGLGTFVPRRSSGTNGSPGEATSVISWNNIGASVNPWKPKDTVLAVNAGFISGTAASVAAAPEGATVVIQSARGETNQTIVAVGTPEQRIGAAIQAYDQGLQLGLSQREVLKAAAAKIFAATNRLAAARQVLAGLDDNALGGQTVEAAANALAKLETPEALEKGLRRYRDSYQAIKQNLDTMNH